MSNSRRSIRNVVAAAVVAAAGVVPVISASVPVDAVSAGVVISQVYGGGGNSGAPLTNDFVELFNRGTSTVDLSGWSVQYASATGTGNFGSNPVVALSGTLAPGRYHLVQLAGGANGVALPAPDATGTINMSGTAGKVALVDTATGLACNGGSTPCAPAQLAQIVDLVGYGSANFFEGTAAPALTNTTAAIRAGGGCTDTDANGADFSAATPAPRNSASPANPCGVVAPVINEFVANHVGTDTNEYVEVLGAPSIDYSAFSVVQIEGDFSGTATGVVDSVQAVGTTGPTGHWVTGFLSNALENGTLTLLLVEGFSGADGDDLDTDDDGVIDITPWTSVSDAVAVTDGGTSDRTYASTVLGADFDGGTFTPGGASRIPDGTDTDTTADWFRNDFDLAGVAGFTGTPVVGEALNTPGAANQAYVPADAAPAVVSTMPADAATDVAIDADVTVEFSEPVDVGADWFLLTCSASGDVGAVVSGGPTTFVLAPASDLALGETCTVTVVAAAVTDQDADDPPDAMAADVSWTFTTTIGDPCALPVTPIPVIQGSGAATPLAGQVVTTSGVVVGDYEGPSPALRGFYLQDPLGDGDDATSDGIFVFNGSSNGVALGDVVRVTGTAAEFQDQTQLSNVTSIVACGTGSVAPTVVALPFESPTSLERFEGMLVTFPQDLSVTEHFQLGRFGQVVVSSGGRLAQPTNVVEPGEPALALQAANDLNRIIVDDALQSQNPDPIAFGRGGNPLTAANTLRGGDTVTDLTGVMTYTWAGNAASGNAYRVRPIGALGGSAMFEPANPRPSEAPEVGGTLRVSAFNVLNYFVTLDYPAGNVLDNRCGPLNDVECRGADSLLELERQRTKLLQALAGLDADVLGLIELENTTGVDVLTDPVNGIVPGLDDLVGAGTYAAVETGVIGTDAIRVGLIYQPTAVTPVGPFEIIDGSDDPRFLDDKNRPALVQTFEEVATGERFTVVVNHLKSKGSGCNDVGDPDIGDGQGNCNVTRRLAAEAIVDVLGSMVDDGTVDPDVLVVGDLNSYAKEDPIGVFEGAGYTNLIEQYGGADAYSYAFDGQWGYLDHALASPSMTAQVVGAAEWHVNADEPGVLDYNTEFKSAGQATSLFAPDEFRTSDHDPVVVGLDLAVPPSVRVVGQLGECASDTMVALAIEITDPDTPLGDLVVTAVGSGAAVVPGSVRLTGDGSVRTLSFAITEVRSLAEGEVVVDVSDGTATVAQTIGVIAGSNADDVVAVPSDGPWVVLGRNGADRLTGGTGTDLLCGGNGDDVLVGGDGDDTLVGARGADQLTGGGGADAFDGGPGADDLTDVDSADGDLVRPAPVPPMRAR